MEKLNYETIKHYQSFVTVEEMDKAVRGFLYKFKSSLSDGAVKVLHFLWTYSVKVVGVSFAKYDTMAEAVGLSRRTVIRAVNTLEELGFIKKIPTARMNGKQGVNLFVIQSFETIDSLLDQVSLQVVTRPVTPNKAENKQCSLRVIKKQNRIVVRETEVEELVGNMDVEEVCGSAAGCGETVERELCRGSKQTFDLKQGEEQQHSAREKLREDQTLGANPSIVCQSGVQLKSDEWHQFDPSFLPEYVNREFVKAAWPFFNAGDIYKLWGRIELAYRKVKLEAHLDDVMDVVLEDFKQVVFLYRAGKVRTSFEGYFYSVLYRSLWGVKVRECEQQWYERVIL
ncbi:helix-turn-helix domain-containing protein [Niallia oryzisoli]|uniref:Helix-turn-helix domain-containing protein n=1 Tax=Niallia oryzisoli TaxID=1737571 RepID=A0ABZ2CAB8_9BACI